jgi:dynein light chain roadblock-type
MSSSQPEQQQQQQQRQENANMVELQETVSRLSSHKGVEAVLILNKQGDILVQSGSAVTASGGEDTTQAKFIRQLMHIANTYVASLMPEDEVSFLQIRSKQHQEIMIAPHGDFVLAVLKR